MCTAASFAARRRQELARCPPPAQNDHALSRASFPFRAEAATAEAAKEVAATVYSSRHIGLWGKVGLSGKSPSWAGLGL